MSKVTFMPMNQTVDAQDGDSILETALNNNIPIQHACGGFCSCTTCHIIVKEKPLGLGKMEEDEEETLARVEGWTKDSRLGCQAKVQGDVIVEVVNLDD